MSGHPSDIFGTPFRVQTVPPIHITLSGEQFKTLFEAAFNTPNSGKHQRLRRLITQLYLTTDM